MSKPGDIEKTRKIVGDLPFFVKADSKDSLRDLVKASFDSDKRGFLMTVPDIIFSSQGTDFRDKIVLEIDKTNKSIKEMRTQ